jgi:hypothetical protein
LEAEAGRRATFELLYQAEKYGARVALFGREIKLTEDLAAVVAPPRDMADSGALPREAVEEYHGTLRL